MQYDINREATKIALSSGKEKEKGKLHSDQRRAIAQAKFTYSPLGKALEKRTKTIENQGENQIKAIEDHGKPLVESNKLIKKGLNINILLEEPKKKYLKNLPTKGLFNLGV